MVPDLITVYPLISEYGLEQIKKRHETEPSSDWILLCFVAFLSSVGSATGWKELLFRLFRANPSVGCFYFFSFLQLCLTYA
jgi:hypothetical protein